MVCLFKLYFTFSVCYTIELFYVEGTSFFLTLKSAENRRLLQATSTCLKPSEQYLSYIMMKTSYISMK
jgi:hypothetical protein